MHSALTRFLDLYSQDLVSCDLAQLAEVYSAKVTFTDPAHRIEGIESLIAYFEHLVGNLSHCTFRIDEVFEQPDSAMLTWEMAFAHPKLAGGKPVLVPGSSLLRFSDKIDFHRDYFDLGSMLYEQVPVLGWAVRQVKKGLDA